MRRPIQLNPLAIEITATAMLLGEHQPLPCSMCLGRGEMPSFFGKRRCVQCDGIGLEAIPDKTCEALGIVWDNYRQVRRKK